MDTTKETKQMRIKLTAKMVAIFGAILVLVSMLIPYTVATEKYMARVEWAEDDLEEATGLNADDMEYMSMVEYTQFFRYVARDDRSMEGFDVFLAIIVTLIGVFALLTLLFAIKKKVVKIIVFDVLTFIVFSVENWVFTQMGIIPDQYNWSAGYYLLFIAVTTVLVAAIWMAVERAKDKNNTISDVELKLPTVE